MLFYQLSVTKKKNWIVCLQGSVQSYPMHEENGDMKQTSAEHHVILNSSPASTGMSLHEVNAFHLTSGFRTSLL